MEPIVMTGGGLLVGWVLGFYQAKAKLAETLQGYIRQSACDDCPVKTDVAEMKKEMRDGANEFSAIKTSLAVIKTKMGIQNELEELRSAIRHYDERKN